MSEPSSKKRKLDSTETLELTERLRPYLNSEVEGKRVEKVVESVLEQVEAAPGAEMYDQIVKNQNDKAVRAIKAATVGIGQLSPLAKTKVHAGVVPVHKAWLKAMSMLDKPMLEAFRRDFQLQWKNTNFRFSKRIKEGKRRYPRSLLDNDGLCQELATYDKDFAKAYILNRNYPSEFLTSEQEKVNRYFSSKGFHLVFWGRPQKKTWKPPQA